MYKINKKNIWVSLILFAFVFTLISPQVAGASIFQPGETLEPDCAPGSVNCGVATGVFSLAGLTSTAQSFIVTGAGSDFSIVSAGSTHTFQMPSSSALARGLLTAGDWSTFNSKLSPANNLSDVANTNTALNTLLPLQTGNTGRFLQTDGSNTSWVTVSGAGLGTVTSVALLLPSIFSVSGSPVTASGTLSASLVSQSPNLIFASPSGASGEPTFRSFVVADLPTGIPNTNLVNSSISLATGTAGADINVSGSPVSLGGTVTLNIPSSSATNRGLLTSADWSTFNTKQTALGFTPLNPANNLSEISATASTARTNLGLGTLATQSGTFSGTSSGTNTGDQTTITGNAGTATALQTPRTINGISFDGTANITVTAAAGTLSGTTLAGGVTASSLTSVGTLANLTVTNPIAGSITGSSASTTGNAGTATALSTPRTINGVSFDGTANITITAAADAGTLTGTTLNSGVTTSSLTSLGTLTALSMGGAITGTTNLSLLADGAGTTGNVQIGAGGAGSTTPDLLVLDTKSTAGDPTGTNGATYYNSNTNKFRCFENSAWKNCDSQPASSTATVRKSADQSVTNATTGDTLVNDTELSFPIGANESWVFRFDLLYATGGGPDIKVAVTAPAGAACDYAVSQFTSTVSVGATACGTSLPVIDGSPTGEALPLAGSVSNGGTAGTVRFQFAQNTSNATATTILRGSNLTAFRIGGGADLGEVYYTKDLSLSSGTVVALDSSLPAGVKRAESGDIPIGIVSTKPGVVIGDTIGADDGVPVIIALAGRVPVAVSTEGGAILPGDYLTSSSTSGVAMKLNGAGKVIGQAISDYNSEGVGMVLAFVKNFEKSGGLESLGETTNVNVDEGEEGISTLISEIVSEIVHDPIAVITQKITAGKQLLTDFVALRVTAIRGYFDELFTKKVHTEQLCLKKTDGSEVCVSGDEFDELLQNNDITPTIISAPDQNNDNQNNETPVDDPLSASEDTSTPIDEINEVVEESESIQDEGIETPVETLEVIEPVVGETTGTPETESQEEAGPSQSETP